MASITFSIASTPVTGNKAYTISDADVTRWLTAAKKYYNDPSQPPLTNAQVLVKWADEVIAQMRHMVADQEEKISAEARPPISTS